MILRQFIMFGGVGLIGTAAHFATLAALVEGIGVDAVVASGWGFAAGALVNYLLNRRLTFRSDAPHAVALPKFLAVAGAGFLLNTLLMLVGLSWLHFHYLLAQALATLLVLFWNFAGNRLWTFRAPSR